MKNYLLFLIATFVLSISVANAQSYTNSTNTLDGSMSNTLINIASSRTEKFFEHNFVIFQNDLSYYIIIFDEYTFNNNVLSFNNATIIRYYRDSTYNSTYQYQIYTENNTSFVPNYIFVSNLNIKNSSSSAVFNEIKEGKIHTQLIMVILAIIFASFLLNERSSY